MVIKGFAQQSGKLARMMKNSAFAPQSIDDKKTQRQHPRYHLSWRIALVSEASGERLAFHGKTRDLSLYGAAMHTEHHVTDSSPLIVLLAPPPLTTAESQKIIEIRARVVYSVYSSTSMCFRLGLEFQKFVSNGRFILEQRLEHHSAALEVRPSGRSAAA